MRFIIISFIAMFLTACSTNCIKSNDANVMVLINDADPDSLSSQSAVSRRVVNEVQRQLSDAGYTVYDETSTGMDHFDRRGSRLDRAELLDMAASARPAMDVAKETQAILNKEKVDVVVADFMMIGSLIAAEAMGIKRVALFHMPEYLPGPGRPPGGMGLLPLNSRLGRLRDKMLTKVFYRVINQYLPPLNSVRKAFSLPLYQSIDDIYHQADLRLIQTSKVFDAPISPAPENVRYVGAVLDDPGWTDPEEKFWSENDSRPFVVVSLSSTFQNQRSALDRIISALSGMDIRCLVTLGPAMECETFKVPENIVVLSGVPHSQVFPQADAVITHAGHGTVMRALAHGLPLVCLPMGRDQIDNAALVAHHGAGLKLSAKARSNQIAKAIKRVLDEPDFTTNAQSLQKDILADAKANTAEKQLENLAAI